MNDDLEERLATMKAEIDALQIASATRSKPWYHNASTLLSIVALLFSFGTTFVSYHKTYIQDIENFRQELRGLLQRLSALPKENVEIQKKYSDDAVARNLVAGLINQENALLARNAAEIAKRLPKNSVSPTELYAIAVALQSSYDLNGADDFLDRSIKANPDFNTEIAALRTLAAMKFLRGKPEAGRVDYQKALDIFSKYPQYDAFTKASTNVLTETYWALSEASGGSFKSAYQHLQNAEAILEPLRPAPGVDMLRAQVTQVRKQLESGLPPTDTSVPPAPLTISATQLRPPKAAEP